MSTAKMIARMLEADDQFAAEITAWLERAAAADTAEDAELGDQRGDAVPDWLSDKQQRLDPARRHSSITCRSKAARWQMPFAEIADVAELRPVQCGDRLEIQPLLAPTG